MAENIEKTKQYQYTANSNLVLQADRNSLPRRDQEPSGEPESLYGKIDPKQFGSRALRDTSQLVKDKEKKKKLEQEDDLTKLERARRRKIEKALSGGYGYSSILAATEDFEGLAYRPKTKETRSAYELILSFVSELLGDQTHDVIRSATDTILRSLKDDGLKDFDKKREIESIIGPISSERFAQAVNLAKKLNDYQASTGSADTGAVDEEAGANADKTLDEQLGVAVLFDEGEEEEDNQVFEVRDESDGEGDEGGEDTAAAGQPPDQAVFSEEREEEEESIFVVGGAAAADENEKKKNKKKDTAEGRLKDKLEPHDIDAFWLQRVISHFYPDPHTAGEKTAATMKILSNLDGLDTRDCENELMELFVYTKFDLVKVLTHNREMIVWCTRLVRASVDERPAIEEEMKRRGAEWILKDLAGERTRRGEGRARKGVVEGAMEIDQGAGQRPAAVPAVLPAKGAVTKEGSKFAPRAVLDLDALAFSQGGHLMSNKKCKLPEGSFKRTDKGYEEIHVPAPKPKPFADNEKLIPISDMPEWTRAAFKGAKSLNRVQ
ncbi:MAG: pre-mRNA splicing factor, partial [Olpidium bornovanus]